LDCVCENAYPKSYELNCTETEANASNARQNSNEADGIAVELEANRFWEKHRPYKRSFGSIES
jgi:hypothetical protein